MANEFLDGIVSRAYAPVRPTPTRQTSTTTNAGTPFADVLRQATDEPSTLKVSAHAASRMQQRGLRLSQEEWQRVGNAVDKAGQKGAKDAYVLYGDTGFVVNVPNRTVVTAMHHQEDTIVTNIDSVVAVPRLDR